MVTREQIKINNVPIRVQTSFEREVQDERGHTVGEIEVAIIIRGRMPDKQFLQLLSRDHLQLEYMDGRFPISMTVRIAHHSAVASGTGEGTVFRHDIVFRETPESYAQRATAHPVVPDPVQAVLDKLAVQQSMREQELLKVRMAQEVTTADPAAWGEAIRQMRGEAPVRRPPQEPLSLPQLAAIETVLASLRLDALLQLLEEEGFVMRDAVEERFRALLPERFVSEAVPLVGESVAKRALGDLTGGD